KPGFNSDRMITMWMNFTSQRYSVNDHSTQFLDQLLPRVAALPGVEGVAISNDLPLEGDDTTTGLAVAEGHAAFERAQRPMIGVHVVNSGYFHSMGIPLLRGRELAASDTTKSNPVVVINQKVAEEIYPGQDPLGRHITILGDKQLEVVGVAGNVL